MQSEERTHEKQQLVLARKLISSHPKRRRGHRKRSAFEMRSTISSSPVTNDMAPLYEALVADKVLDLDQKTLDGKIEDELKKVDEKLFEEGGDILHCSYKHPILG